MVSNVVPILPTSTATTSCALEGAFRRKQDTLIQYLKFRLNDATEAHDVAQAAFLRLWERRNTLHTEALEALLFVTARNIANDLLRNRSRNQGWLKTYAENTDEPPDTLDSPERILVARQNLKIIKKILAELPENCRSAFIRYKFDGHEYERIAHDMGVSQSMVRKHVLRATSYCSVRFSEMEEWV